MDDVDTTGSVGYRVIQVQEIKMGSKLGTGAYVDVFKGKWHNSNVAVKVLKYTHDNFEAVKQEAIIMTKLGNHPNVPFNPQGPKRDPFAGWHRNRWVKRSIQ